MQVQGVLVFVYFYLLCPTNIIGLWWAVGSPLVMDPNSICRKSRRLAGKQREICRNEIEIVEEVANGAKLALAECQYQFRNRKWNCTTSRRTLARVLRRDTRESAFVYAVTAAGVVYAVTEACSMGNLLQCTCDNNIQDITTDGEWEWGGCGDNVDFGYKKSKEFMDARKKKRRGDITTIIQLHNNDAGRMAVKGDMRSECKCHGLSGSCTLKTCWLKMPIFRQVGLALKEKFDGAIKVIGTNDGKGVQPEEDTIKPQNSLDLIYSENSPNFCKRNRKHGSLGTRGRMCDPSSMGVGGCDLLCCHRGYEKETVHVRENCKCRFIWCCDVICETCESTKDIYRCL
ncbi:protein Wnt-6-like isoform X1 [Mizuhopecten yessoensis]|uniref:Protein Wnt n=2 Tax=Mizuhopecten yessoensis TaxID=6573 RepID=A0A210R2V8_MIZYE|nr:protein Wnt-6-like isoform X1 [Mizuhopecten yessoensis]OWF55275.1 Protein Wnt-6 [Mizuhopecten yessoensis]